MPTSRIDGLLDVPAVHLLTSDADLIACREAVLAAMVGSLSIGAPCLGREPEHVGSSLVVASPEFAVGRRRPAFPLREGGPSAFTRT